MAGRRREYSEGRTARWGGEEGLDLLRHDEWSAGSSALFLTALAAVSQGLSFCYRVALSRLVGAEVMGLYQLLMPVCSVLLSLTAVGLTAAMSNLSSQYLALGNGKGVAQTRRMCLTALGVGLLPVSAAVVAFYDPISGYLLGDARTQLGLILLLPCVALTGVENIHKHFFYGTGVVRPPAVVELMEQFIRAAAVLGLLVLFLPQNPERTVGLIVTGMVICEIFSAVALTVLYRRRMARIGRTGPGERGGTLARRVTSIAVPVGATALLGNLMSAVNAALIPQKLVESGMDRAAAMSEFGVVCGMTLPMLALPTVFLGALNLVLVPRLAYSTALNRPEEVRRRAGRAMLAVSVLILPSMALMVVLGPDLARMMFGQPSAGEHLLPLAAAMALSCYQSTLGGVLNGVGRPGSHAMADLICDGIQLAFTFTVGLPGVGIRGFVAGTLVSAAAGALLNGWLVVRYTGLRPSLFRWVTAPGLAALLAALTSNLLFRWLKDSGVSLLAGGAASLLFGGVLYLAALSAQGVYLSQVFRLRK